MKNNINILFCGVESTGKTTTVSKLSEYLKLENIDNLVLSEVGRDICDDSGGVDKMDYFDYENILFTHQKNLLSLCENLKNNVLLIDTDSIYTIYYLMKDKELMSKNKKRSKQLIKLGKQIAKINKITNRITYIFYLNSNSEFVQDGTRTYENSRKSDDKFLYKLYKNTYGKNNIIYVNLSHYEDRYNFILNKVKIALKTDE